MTAESEKVFTKQSLDQEISFRRTDLEEMLQAYALQNDIEATVFIKIHPGRILEIFMDLFYTKKESPLVHYVHMSPRPDYIALLNAINAIEREPALYIRRMEVH